MQKKFHALWIQHEKEINLKHGQLKDSQEKLE